jgi:DNA mismatch repair ATPase MutS
METNLLPKEAYQQNIEKYSGLLNSHKKTRSNLGWLRLLSVVAIAIAAYYGFVHSLLAGWIIVIAGISLFLFLVSLDLKNDEKIYYYEKLLLINQDELNILAGQYSYREDGLAFLPHEHAYAHDLDLFGESSIYQYINRCTSEQAKELLAVSLLVPAPSEVIVQRQEAANELKQQLHWRQQLQFTGIANPVTLSTEEKILSWLHSATAYHQKYWHFIVAIFPVITLACLAAFVFGLMSSAVFSMLVLVFYITSVFVSRKIEAIYSVLFKIEKEVGTIYHQLKHLETLSCTSVLLTSLQKDLQCNGTAYESIKQLKRILNRFDYRLNAITSFILNTFLLWDVRQVLSLNKWKEKYAAGAEKWFSTIANIELISTLATLTYNHSSWNFPLLAEQHFTLETAELGHPLISADKRVNNSYTTEGTPKVSIITGSNMAGKSTFLRSIGVNLVLAQMGAPVCAKSFVFSSVQLCTSMRISDNLAENTSTFYAELKKLKTIIEKVNAGEKVFILLDEILRGTNSLDKHTGSEALIKQFIRKQAVAIIATHDVELGNLKKEYEGHIENYYFDVQVEGDELYFDYKLKSGICQSMNASLLMKKIGIEIDR